MAVDTSIYSLLRPVSFGLESFEQSRANAFNFRSALSAEKELEAQRVRAEQTRQAYRQQYGEAPGGLAGPAPAPAPAPAPGLGGASPAETFPPLAEQEAAATQQALYGQGAATPMENRERPGGPGDPRQYVQTMENRERPGGPGDPRQYVQTMENRERPGGPGDPRQYVQTMGAGGLGSQSPSQNPFIRKLYTIDPAAGREAEKHAMESRKLELAHAKERVEHLGRVADGVLAVQTQEAHNAGRAMLIGDGMPASQIPVPYDPKIWQMFSGMAVTSADKLRAGELEINRQKFQYEQRQKSSKVPDYGLGDKLNPVVYGMFGDQIQPGERPTPAMEQAGRAKLASDEAEAERVKQGLEAPGKLTEVEKGLRGEFTNLTKDYRTVSDAYGRIQASAKDPSAAGDLALIFSYMKLLDPGSTVREGEFATAASAGNIPERVIAEYNRLVTSGERLSDTMKADFVDRANRLYDQSTKDYEKTKTQFEGLARRKGADPANVTLEFGSTAERGTGTAPASGKPSPAKPRSPYAGRPVESLTPAQRKEELDFLKANP